MDMMKGSVTTAGSAVIVGKRIVSTNSSRPARAFVNQYRGNFRPDTTPPPGLRIGARRLPGGPALLRMHFHPPGSGPAHPEASRRSPLDKSLTAQEVAWQRAAAQVRGPRPAPGAIRAAAAARDTLVRDTQAQLDELRQFGAAVARGELPQPDPPDALRQAKLQCMRAAVTAVLPDLFRQESGAELGPDRDTVRLLEHLLDLDERLVGTGHAGYRTDQLLAALCRQACIRELSGGPDKRAARDGLLAMAGSMLDALRPARDGAALDGLLGVEPAFDGAIRALRIDTTRAFMFQQAWRDQKGSPDQAQAQARTDATDLVDREMEIARARQQLQRAMAQQGMAHTLGGAASVKVDVSLVEGLRGTLGEQGEKVGMLVAALFELERSTAASPGAQRLARDIDTALSLEPEAPEETPPPPDEKGSVPDGKQGAQARERGSEPEMRREDALYLRQRRDALRAGNPELAEMQALQKNLQNRLNVLQAALRQMPKRGEDDKGAGREKQMRDELESVKDVLVHATEVVDRLTVADLSVRKTGGMGDAELASLGLNDSKDHPLEVATTLTRMGLSGAAQARDVFAGINSVMRDVNRAGGLRQLVDHGLPFLEGAKDDIKAQRLGDALKKTIGGGLAERLAGLGVPDEDGSPNTVQKLGVCYVEERLPIQGKLAALADMDAELAQARAALKAYAQDRPGINVDNPQGYESCKKVRTAIGTLERHEFKLLRDQLDQVRGFDPDRLHTPWRGAPRFGMNELQNRSTDPQFVPALDAVIRLREITPARATLVAELAPAVGRMAGLLEHRRLNMGDVAAPLRDAIRAAILGQRGTTPIHEFRPREHEAGILKQLASWGVPVDDVMPEIQAELSMPFGPDTLNRWQSEMQPLPHDSKAPGQWLDQLQKSIDSLEIGTKVKLTAGTRIEMQTGAIPLEPTGIASINLKLAPANLSGLEIARGLDGIELVLRKGWDVKGGADVAARLVDLKGLGVKAEAVLSGELARARSSGVLLRIPTTPGRDIAACRDTAKKVLQLLFAGNEITPEQLGKVPGVSIAPLEEHKKGGKAGLTGKVGFDPTSAFASGGGKHVGPALQLRGGVTAGRTGTHFAARNVGFAQIKTESEVSVDFAVVAAMSKRAGLPTDGERMHNLSSDLVEAGLSMAYVSKRKTKDVLADGLLQVGTERLAQMYVPAGRGMEAATRLGGEAFTALMKRLEDSDRDEENNTALSIRKLVNAAGVGDQISIASTLDSRVFAIVNNELMHAQRLRNGQAGSGTQAQRTKEADEVEAGVRRALEDPASYNIARISVIPAQERLETFTKLNLLAVKYTTYVENRSEFVAAEIKPDPRISAAVSDALLAAGTD